MLSEWSRGPIWEIKIKAARFGARDDAPVRSFAATRHWLWCAFEKFAFASKAMFDAILIDCSRVTSRQKQHAGGGAS
jgi:hypothetical protein